RQILVERFDYPVAVRISGAEKVGLIAIAVRIPRGIKPIDRNSLPIVRTGEQSIHDPLISVLARIASERGHFIFRWREARQVERHATQPTQPTGGGGGARRPPL